MKKVKSLSLQLFEKIDQNIFFNLNEFQREAVESIDGPHLVLAGPGTGKTTVITYKTIYLLKNNYNPENLLILTFTNKAAEEMQKRIKKYTNLKIPYLGTFHSVIIKLLKEIIPIQTTQYKINEKINIVDEEDKIEIIKNIISTKKNIPKIISPYVLSNLISAIKNKKNISISEKIQELITEYNHFLQKINSLDFDDIILCINNILNEKKEIRKKLSRKFKYIIVDEYQDINLTQFEFLLNLTESNKNIFVVGDDDQSIYSFRNSEVKIMLDFPKYFNNTKIINLQYNYRSSSEIIKTYSKLISFNINRFDKKLIPTRKIKGEIEIKIFNEETKEYQYIAEKINQNKQSNKSIAILCRTNEIAKNFEKNLIKLGIKAKFLGGYNFFERKEIKDIISFLKVINNPKDDISLIRILKNFFNIQQKKIKKIITNNEKNVIEILQEEKYEIYEILEKMIERSQNETIENIILEIVNLRKDFLQNNIVNTFINFVHNTSENYKTLEEFINYITIIKINNEQNLEDTSKVWIMTMHASKGLEFDIVFVSRIQQGIIPHFKVKEEEKEEERRLLYVAMSRAKEKLYLSTTIPPSEFLLSIM